MGIRPTIDGGDCGSVCDGSASQTIDYFNTNESFAIIQEVYENLDSLTNLVRPSFLFDDIGTIAIPANVDTVISSGKSQIGLGAGVYVNDDLATALLAAAHPEACKETLNNRYFRLLPFNGTILPEQTGCIGDDDTDDYIGFNAACQYAMAVGAMVGLTARSYAVRIPQRTTDNRDVHFYDGQAFVLPVGGKLYVKGLWAGNKVRPRIRFLHHTGAEFADAWDVMAAGTIVWRGMGFFLRGHTDENVPDDFDERTGITLENIELDGTKPRDHFAGSAWPANPVDGTGWDITHKPISAENDRFVGDFRLINCKFTRWGGEMLYVAGKSFDTPDPDLTERRDPICFLRNCEFIDGDGSGLNTSAVFLDADGVLVENLNMATESWLGHNGRLTNLIARDCYQSGGFSGGKINTTGVGVGIWDPTRIFPDEVPKCRVDATFINCVGQLGLGSWLSGSIRAVDTPVTFGSAPFSLGSRECDLDIEMVTDQTTLAKLRISGSAAGTMYTDRLMLRVKSVRTAEAIAAGRTVTTPVDYLGSLGPDNWIEVNGQMGAWSGVGIAAALTDYAPRFSGSVPFTYTGFTLASSTWNVETTPAIDLRVPFIGLTTTTAGVFPASLPLTLIANGTEIVVRNGTANSYIVFSGTPTLSGVRDGPFVLGPGRMARFRFDRQYWTPLDPSSPKAIITDATNARSFTVADEGSFVRLTHDGGAITYTLPSNATLAVPIGAETEVWHEGTSTLTFAAGGGATVVQPTGKTLLSVGAGARIRIKKIGTNQWSITGDLGV
jgi:hypothetical protein